MIDGRNWRLEEISADELGFKYDVVKQSIFAWCDILDRSARLGNREHFMRPLIRPETVEAVQKGMLQLCSG